MSKHVTQCHIYTFLGNLWRQWLHTSLGSLCQCTVTLSKKKSFNTQPESLLSLLKITASCPDSGYLGKESVLHLRLCASQPLEDMLRLGDVAPHWQIVGQEVQPLRLWEQHCTQMSAKGILIWLNPEYKYPCGISETTFPETHILEGIQPKVKLPKSSSRRIIVLECWNSNQFFFYLKGDKFSIIMENGWKSRKAYLRSKDKQYMKMYVEWNRK